MLRVAKKYTRLLAMSSLGIHETRAIAVLGSAGTPPRLRTSASTSELSKITLPPQPDRRDATGAPGEPTASGLVGGGKRGRRDIAATETLVSRTAAR
jgi:hypothetical protein